MNSLGSEIIQKIKNPKPQSTPATGGSL